ncbi:MAG: hypothetical protein U0931_36820 [Vulcanimicrobiota bacterium]
MLSLESPVTFEPLGGLIFETRSDYQRIRLFKHAQGFALFLNDTIQWESREEVLLNQLMVSVPLGLLARPRQVLILGGGFGLGARAALDHPEVDVVEVVEIDAEVVRLARQSRILRKLNRRSLDDSRVRVRVQDVFDFQPASFYDLIVFDCDVSATRQRGDASVAGLVELLLRLRASAAAFATRIPIDDEYMDVTDQLDGCARGDDLERTAALVQQAWPQARMLDLTTTYGGRELYVWDLPDYCASSLTTEYVSRVTSAGISS